MGIRTKIDIDLGSLNLSWLQATTYRLELVEGFVIEDGDVGQPNPAVASLFSFTTNATGPSQSSSTPSNGGFNVTQTSSLQLVFNRKIYKGTGNIYIYKVGTTDTLISTIDVASASTSITDYTLTITTTGIFNQGSTQYYILTDANIVKDVDNFTFAGISSSNTFKFTTAAPTSISSTSPSSGATDVVNSTSITFTFDRNIFANTGSIKLYKVGSPDSLINSFSITDATKVTISGATVTLNVTGYLTEKNTQYYYLFDASVVKDTNNILYPGLTNTSTIRYTTSNGPVFSSGSNVQSDPDGSLSTSATIVYDRTLTKVTGNIYLYKVGTTDTLLETFAVTNTSKVTVTGRRGWEKVLTRLINCKPSHYWLSLEI
jgi:hypothetical protein